MINSVWVCFCTIVGVYVIYERALYFSIFFIVSYSLGMLLRSISDWGYLNPLILLAWLSIIPGIFLSTRTVFGREDKGYK